jgi:hypothetical protein
VPRTFRILSETGDRALPHDFIPVFEALKAILAKYREQLAIKVDTPSEYTLLTRLPSPFPQHKGQPMYFGSVRLGKAYVSFHLMPLYMCEPLTKAIPPTLVKRMQGKTCFNFKALPDPEILRELNALTAACCQAWEEKNWL